MIGVQYCANRRYSQGGIFIIIGNDIHRWQGSSNWYNTFFEESTISGKKYYSLKEGRCRDLGGEFAEIFQYSTVVHQKRTKLMVHVIIWDRSGCENYQERTELRAFSRVHVANRPIAYITNRWGTSDILIPHTPVALNVSYEYFPNIWLLSLYLSHFSFVPPNLFFCVLNFPMQYLLIWERVLHRESVKWRRKCDVF